MKPGNKTSIFTKTNPWQPNCGWRWVALKIWNSLPPVDVGDMPPLTHYSCLCSGQPSMWCFLFFATVLRLPNPPRERPCLNTCLVSTERPQLGPQWHIHTCRGRTPWECFLGGGHNSASPSRPTDFLASVFDTDGWVFFWGGRLWDLDIVVDWGFKKNHKYLVL